MQRLGEVERGLAAERRQQRVGALALDHLAHGLGQQRLDVGRGRELRVGHDRRRVRVDEHDLVALLEQHLAGLRAGVVELGRLADHDRAGAEDEDLVEVVAPRHAAELRRGESSNRARQSFGPGPASGWYWTQPRGHVEQPQALDGAVVEVDVRELGLAEVGLQPRARLAAHREAVVLRGDRDAAGAQVLDRVVGAAVAERELERLQPDRAREQLVAEADAEHRLAPDQRADGVDDVVERGGVAGAGHEEDAVGVASRAAPRRAVVHG